jgi:hypothetical protein
VDHAKFILYFESNLEPLKSLTQAREIDLWFRKLTLAGGGMWAEVGSSEEGAARWKANPTCLNKRGKMEISGKAKVSWIWFLGVIRVLWLCRGISLFQVLCAKIFRNGVSWCLQLTLKRLSTLTHMCI